MGRTLARLLIVPLAFLAGCGVAMTVLVTLGIERATHVVHGAGAGSDPETLGTILSLLLQGALLTSALTLLPAVALVIVGEVARIRSAYYYVLGGGATLALVPVLARLDQKTNLAMPPHTVMQILATAGFAGGFVYWLMAGRRA